MMEKRIFNRYGDEFGGTREELDDHLVQLANKVPSKSSGCLQFPPTR